MDPTSTPPVYLPDVAVGADYLGIRIGGINADLGDGVADRVKAASAEGSDEFVEVENAAA